MATLFEQFDNVEIPTQTKSNEWYTPARYVDAAREVMGGIDLDPASCEMANRIVKAMRYYTKDGNGLSQDWTCMSLWLNPPYGRENNENSRGTCPGGARRGGGGRSVTALFIFKLLQEYQYGNVKQAILLITTDTDATWFQPLWNYPICFTDHRVLFIRPDQPRQSQFFGTAFVYLGPNEAKFIEVFSQFGRITKAIDIPKPQPTMRTLWEVE